MIPIERLHHITVVVRDLRAAARGYALLYGIERWDVAHHTADDLRDTSAFGFAATFAYSTATGETPGGITFRLVRPAGGMSTFAEFLVTRGEGIHSLCLAPAGELDAPLGQSATVAGVRHRWFDTRAALGGWYVEVAEDGQGRADERWELGGEIERPPGLEGLLAVPRIGHFGIAVRDLMGRLPAYASLLGLTEWRFVHFRPEPGSLERSTLDGEEVRHSFLLAIADVAGVGFELIQPTVEPTHYRRHLLDPFGEGIHHLLLLPDEPEERFARLRVAMEGLGAPVATSGVVRGGASEYAYFDTRSLLGGYLVEAILRYVRPTGGSEPDYRFDFSNRV